MVGARLPEHIVAAHAVKRTRMSCRVLLSACPIWSEPVTFGGGMTMEKAGAPGLAPAPARKAPASSQAR